MNFLVKMATRGAALIGLASLSGMAMAGSGLQPTYQFPTPVAVSASQTQSVAVTVQTTGTIASLAVLTQGKGGGDYIAATPGTCATGQSYSAGQSCILSVKFTPTAPGGRLGAVELLDANGAVLGTTLLYGYATGSAGVLVPANMTTIAGNGTWLYRQDDVPATSASIFLPGGVAVDGTGNVFISDTNNNRVRRVDASTGMISTVAGIGSPSSAGDGGSAISAGVSSPGAMVINGAGDLLFVDSGNHAVRKLTLATGILSTVAGQLGRLGASGDGGQATAALLDSPQGIALDAAGNLYIGDTDNHAVRKVNALTGIITTIAGQIGASSFSGDGGPGTAATLMSPYGLSVDAAGDLYIADQGTNRVRMLSAAGTISTVAGTGAVTYNGDGQAATAANLKGPTSVAVDVAGNLYVADSGNNRIRKVGVGTNLITTIAGTGDPTFGGDGGAANAAGMYGPYALTLDSMGNVFFSDIFHHRIRELQNSLNLLKYPAIQVGRTSAPMQVTLENDGNDLMNITALAADNDSAIDSASTTCVIGSPMPVDATCMVGAEFVPQTVANPGTAVIQLQTNAGNTPQVLSLSGEVDALNPTTTALTSSVNPAALGAPITFTAVVTSGATAATGNVKFFDGNTLIGTSAIGAGSAATLTTSTLTLGSHSITAAFTGDAANSPSTSAPLTEVVKQTPAFTLTSSLNPSKVGQSITFTATISAPTTMPTGNLVFTDQGISYGTAAINSSGVATFTSANFVHGVHRVTALYSGDANTLSGSSAVLSQEVDFWPTSTSLASTNPTATVGTPVTFNVHVSPTSSAAPTGTVALNDGPNLLATMTLNGGGDGSYTTSSLSAGTHSLTAVFSGDTTNDTSTSTALTETISPVTTTVTLAPSANPQPAGATLHLTATVTGTSTNATAGNPTGTVSFTEGSTTLGTGTLSGSGVATLDLTDLSVGTHMIVANYAGDNYHAAGTSAVLAEVLQLATTSVQVVSSVNPSIAGKTVTLTAVVSGNGGVPTGNVTFMDGATAVGTTAVNGSGQATVTLSNLTTGSHTITAVYSGDTKDATSTSSPLTQTVQQGVTGITLTSSVNPSFAGAAVTFNAALTSTGSLPAGQITLSDGGTVIASTAMSPTGTASFTLSTLSAGTHNLVASYAGDADHAASSSATLAQEVNIGTSLVALSSSKNPSVFGDSVTFGVTVTGTAQQPGGTVTLMDGATALATLTLNGSGVASFTTTTLAIGDHALTAIYGGDTTHAGSTSRGLTQRVQQAITVTTVSSLNPSKVGDSVRFTATVTGASGAPITGTVSFADAATVLGTATVANGVATFDISTLTAGAHLILATYSGDATNVSAVAAGVSQAVNTAGTSVTVASSANPSVAGTQVTFTATVTSAGKTPSGSVDFMDGSTVIGSGTVANGTATFTTSSLTAGQHAIVARYGGDAGTQVSTSSALIEVTQNKTTLALASSVNPALTVQGITLTATLANGSSATGVVTFTDGTAKIGSVALDANGTAVLTLPSLAAGSHSLAASYSGDSYNLASASAGVTEVVNLRGSATSMTVSSNTYLSGGQVTLVGVVSANGPVAPTGTVTFMSGTQSLGSAQLSPAGAATVTIFPVNPSYDIVAVYAGDGVYSGSTAAKYTITAGASTTFTLGASVKEIDLPSGGHMTMDLTMTSVKGFNDTMALGCLGLPLYATCTFSTDKQALTANGTAVVHLTVDTGNPLGIGASTTAKVEGAGMSRTMQAGLLIPGAALMAMLFGLRRRFKLPPLLALIVLLALGAGAAGMTGCASNTLTQSQTPAGSYTIRIVASGTQSGASQAMDIPMVVSK